MNSFTNVYEALKEISNHERRITDPILSVHFAKLCVLISATEFERCIKDIASKFLKSPKASMATTNRILLASNKKDKEFVYSLLHCNDDQKNFRPSVEMFFAIFGSSFRAKVNSSFPRYMKKQLELCDKKLRKLPTGSQEHIALSDEIRTMQLVPYIEAQNQFLELKHLRNKLAHNYMDTTAFTTYTVDNIIEKFSKGKLFVGALEMAFDFYTVK